MAQWERAQAALPAEQSSKDELKRSEIWANIDADKPDDIEVTELEHGLKIHLDVGELFNIGDAVKNAYVYAREVHPDGPEEKLLFSEFRILMFYLKRLLAVLQVLQSIGVSEDQELQKEQVIAVEPALEKIGVILPNISELWTQLRNGLECEDIDLAGLEVDEEEELLSKLREAQSRVPFHRFTDWAVRQGLTSKLFELGKLTETITAFDFRASARVTKKHHPKLWDRQQPVEAVVECLTADDVDIKLLKEIISQGRPDVNHKDKHFSWTPGHFAANTGRVDLIQALWQKKADLQAKCRVGNTALHVASRKGCDNAVKFLCAKLKLGAIQVQNEEGMASLTYAAMNGHDEVVRQLLSSEAEVNTADADGRSPAMWAVRHGHLTILNVFLEHGFNLNAEDKHGATVMDHAVDHLEMQTLLIEHEHLNNRLLEATQRSNIAEVTQLLDLKGYVNAKDSIGFTPLSWAILNNATDLVKLLAQRNANPHATDFSTLELGEDKEAIQSALDFGLNTGKRLLRAAKRDNWEQVHAELALGANVNQKEEGSLVTVLMCAAIYGHPKEVSTLVDQKALPNQRDSVGWTVSHYAAFGGNCEMVSLLLHRKADFGIKSYEQQTMLHLAARADYGDMVQLLILAHAKTTAKDSSHHVPLQIAAEWGSSEALSALLACDADPSVKDADGRTLMMTACIHGYTSIVKILLDPEPVLPEIPVPSGMKADLTDKEKEPFMLIIKARKEQEKIQKKKFKYHKLPWLAEQDGCGNYPVGLAIMSGREHMVPTLLELKTQVDIFDRKGNTPLMLSAQCGYQQLVETLMVKKATLKQENQEGKTAMDLAKTDGIRRLIQKRIIEKSLPKRKVDTKSAPPEEETEDQIVYRIRMQGLLTILLPDLLRDEVQAFLRRSRSAEPIVVDIVVDPISERPLGYAYLDFEEQWEADTLASQKGCRVAGVPVRLVNEGPRLQRGETDESLTE